MRAYRRQDLSFEDVGGIASKACVAGEGNGVAKQQAIRFVLSGE